MNEETTMCDHCELPVHLDRNGYWAGPDNTSDCRLHPNGHTVNGSIHDR